MYKLFDDHLATPGGDAAEFHPKLTMGALKPFIVEFVETGMQACRTPEFKETIKKAFANDGRFADIRSSERQAIALAELAALGNAQLVVPLPEGEEKQEVGFAMDELANEIENFLNEDYLGDAAADNEDNEA